MTDRTDSSVFTRVETCRCCRDEDRGIVEADFIVWGKLFPQGALGPRCSNCVSYQLGHDVARRPSQYAVFDLRPYLRGDDDE